MSSPTDPMSPTSRLANRPPPMLPLSAATCGRALNVQGRVRPRSATLGLAWCSRGLRRSLFLLKSPNKAASAIFRNDVRSAPASSSNSAIRPNRARHCRAPNRPYLLFQIRLVRQDYRDHFSDRLFTAVINGSQGFHETAFTSAPFSNKALATAGCMVTARLTACVLRAAH